jgi:hypothetical protein
VADPRPLDRSVWLRRIEPPRLGQAQVESSRSVDYGKRESHALVRPTTRWSRPGQPGVWFRRDTSLGLAGRLISKPLGGDTPPPPSEGS